MIYKIIKKSLIHAAKKAIDESLSAGYFYESVHENSDFLPIVLCSDGDVELLDWHEQDEMVDGHCIYRFFPWKPVDRSEEREEKASYLDRVVNEILETGGYDFDDPLDDFKERMS